MNLPSISVTVETKITLAAKLPFTSTGAYNKLTNQRINYKISLHLELIIEKVNLPTHWTILFGYLPFSK